MHFIIHRSGPAAVYTATGLCPQFDPSKTFPPPPGRIARRDRRPAVVQEIDLSILLREPLILKVKETAENKRPVCPDEKFLLFFG